MVKYSLDKRATVVQFYSRVPTVNSYSGYYGGLSIHSQEFDSLIHRQNFKIRKKL